MASRNNGFHLENGPGSDVNGVQFLAIKNWRLFQHHNKRNPQSQARKLPIFSYTDSALNQLYKEKWNKEILKKMAANVQALKTKQAKNYQAHLLCLALITLLQAGKQ